MGIKHDFRQVGDIISIHDIVCAIKRAVLDYVEYMRLGNHERVLERDRIASRELELFAVSLEWMKPPPVWEELFERADHNPSKVFTEKELDKIQFQINENGDDLKSTIYKALAYWQATEVHKSKGKYTELYMIEQTERFRRAKGFGFEIDREGEMLRNWLANIHAINWLKEVEQHGRAAADQQEESGDQGETADIRIPRFIRKFLTTATEDGKRFYVTGQKGKKPKGAPLIKDHIKELYNLFCQEAKTNKEPTFAFSVFEGAWKRYKTALKKQSDKV